MTHCEQVVTEQMGEKYIAMKLKDQERALQIIDGDPELKDLQKLTGPLLDLEVQTPLRAKQNIVVCYHRLTFLHSRSLPCVRVPSATLPADYHANQPE